MTMEFIDSLLPDGWERDADVYGMDFNLVCPHGWTIEQDGYHEIREGEELDGEQPGQRCVSPMRTMGLI